MSVSALADACTFESYLETSEVMASSLHAELLCIRRRAPVLQTVPIGSTTEPALLASSPVNGAASNGLPSNEQGSAAPARREAIGALTAVGVSPTARRCNRTLARLSVLFLKRDDRLIALLEVPLVKLLIGVAGGGIEGGQV